MTNVLSTNKVHPLRKWMDFFNVSSFDLEKTTEKMSKKEQRIPASTIRRICAFNNTSIKNVKILSLITGIPHLVFFMPMEHKDFDVSGCRANNIHASITC